MRAGDRTLAAQLRNAADAQSTVREERPHAALLREHGRLAEAGLGIVGSAAAERGLTTRAQCPRLPPTLALMACDIERLRRRARAIRGVAGQRSPLGQARQRE